MSTPSNTTVFEIRLRRSIRTLRKCLTLAVGGQVATSSGHLDETLAGRIRAEQARSVLRHTTSMTAAGALNAALLVVTLWPNADRFMLLAWAAAIFLASSFIIARRMIAGSKARPSRVSRRALRRINRNALAFGLLWGAVPVLFFADASQGARIVISCICAGMIGGGAFAFASVPSAAIAIIGPVAVGSIWSLSRFESAEYHAAVVLVLCYAAVLIRGVLLHALQMMREFVSHTEVEQLAKSDSLTNLDNRATFRGIVADALLRLERAKEPSSVFYIDINGIEQINSQYGHAVGDEMLIDAARRMQGLMRRVDRVARLDGEYFAILAPGITGEATIRAYANRLIQAFEEPIRHDGVSFSASVCVGAFVLQGAGANAETALRNAALALQKAQRNGRGSYYLFGPKDDAAQLERIALEQDLRVALDRRELYLNFQPMLHLATNRITGFEALLRWRHPTRGNVPPSVFIPIAEETGMIETIGAWVMREACTAAASWPRDVRVCVNVSAFQLRSRAICAQISAAIEEAEIDADQLEVEITETVLVADDPLPLEILMTLRKSGVHLALDDFGVGYSSLSYLRRLPFGRIKIDRSFVSDIVTDRESAAIVKSIIGLAADLGMDVIAEGIETAEQMEFLRGLNCPDVQGYLIGKPMSEEDALALLKRGHRLAAA